MEQVAALSRNIFKYTSGVGTAVWEGFSAMASNNKSPRLIKKIGTHDGMFHCDEALACFMLKQLPIYKDAEIVRTRNSSILDECDIVVDVGFVYDPKINRFDHHQRSFTETLNSVRQDLTNTKFNNIRLSSAGLIYAHFGLEVISEVLKARNFVAGSECLTALYLYIYEGFIEELDAIDNGIPMYAEGKPLYRINTHLGARIHRLNPVWNAPESVDTDSLFRKAMQVVGSEFQEIVLQGYSSWWPARAIVKKMIAKRKEFYETGEIIILDERCSWKDHIYTVEEELGIVGEIKFVLFPDKSAGTWRVQGVAVQPDSFICRVFLHKDWRGVRDEELSKVAGIEGCLFCHSTGFIGGNKSKEGAKQMAIASLKAAEAGVE
ncbi:MYG1 protein [Cylas formicarius]|uniref:MYG1 protein n=1 Tax=Cylas formicarius TaxID=197179 RepID=UPI00295835A0|nr:MYG1 protein [Cylas formicarius]